MWKTLTVLVILLAGAGATIRYLNTDTGKLEQTLLERSKTNKAFVEEQLNTMDAEIATHTEQGTETAGEAEQVGENLETARGTLSEKETAKTTIEGQIAEKQAKLDGLKAQMADIGELEGLVGTVDGLQLEMATVQQDLLTASVKFKSLVASKAASDKRITAYKERDEMVQAGKMASINARVSQNFSDWNFVVISAGANQGVNARTKLDVKSGGETVAKLQVTNLEANVAVCDVLSVIDGSSISTGNRVVVADESKWDPSQAANQPAAAAGGAGAAPAAPAPAPAPADEAGSDPFGLDPAPAGDPEPAAAGDDPFGLGGGAGGAEEPPPADDAGDPFGL